MTEQHFRFNIIMKPIIDKWKDLFHIAANSQTIEDKTKAFINLYNFMMEHDTKQLMEYDVFRQMCVSKAIETIHNINKPSFPITTELKNELQSIFITFFNYVETVFPYKQRYNFLSLGNSII